MTSFEEIKQMYPVGTKFTCPCFKQEYTITDKDRYDTNSSGYIICPSNGTCGRYLLIFHENEGKGKFAEIISSPVLITNSYELY